MNHPQTLAEELAKMFPNADMQKIADFSCCILVVMWCLYIEPDDIEAIKMVQKMRKEGIIRDDCVVFWYKVVPYLTGRELKEVKFTDIKSLKGIKKRTPVLMAKEGNAKGVGHWVGVENARIKFNPKVYSVNVAEGRPTEMRELIF